MKKTAIKMDHKAIISYCKQENRMQLRVYRKKVDAKKMSAYEANKNILIIRELRELVEELERKEVSWQELKQMVKGLPAKRRSVQRQLFDSKNRNNEE